MTLLLDMYCSGSNKSFCTMKKLKLTTLSPATATCWTGTNSFNRTQRTVTTVAGDVSRIYLRNACIDSLVQRARRNCIWAARFWIKDYCDFFICILSTLRSNWSIRTWQPFWSTIASMRSIIRLQSIARARNCTNSTNLFGNIFLHRVFSSYLARIKHFFSTQPFLL